MASSINFSDLPAKLRDYAVQDNSQILTRLLVDDLSFLAFMTLMLGNDEIPLTQLVVDDILQPGGKDAFNPQNDKLKFKARIGKVRACKVDLQFKPEQILQFWKTYLGKITQSKPGSVYDLPFEAFIMERIIAKMKENLHLKAAFKGVYNAAGTTPESTMDGLLTLVKKGIYNATTNATGDIPTANVATGAQITAANALDQVRLVVDKVFDGAATYSGIPMVCLVSPTVKRFYELDYQNTYGGLNYNNGFDKQLIDGTNISFQVEPGMAGSNRIIITPKENLFWLADNEERTDSIQVEKALRNINIMMDFQAAPDYGMGEIIFTNDQD